MPTLLVLVAMFISKNLQKEMKHKVIAELCCDAFMRQRPDCEKWLSAMSEIHVKQILQVVADGEGVTLCKCTPRIRRLLLKICGALGLAASATGRSWKEVQRVTVSAGDEPGWEWEGPSLARCKLGECVHPVDAPSWHRNKQIKVE